MPQLYLAAATAHWQSFAIAVAVSVYNSLQQSEQIVSQSKSHLLLNKQQTFVLMVQLHKSIPITRWEHTHTIVLLLVWNMSGSTRVSRYQKGKTNLDLLEQEIVSGSGICWAICTSAPHADNHANIPPLSFFYRPDALPDAQPTASKHWRETQMGNTDHTDYRQTCTIVLPSNQYKQFTANKHCP